MQVSLLNQFLLGTRHQIKDGTQRQALHPVEVLWEAKSSCHYFQEFQAPFFGDHGVKFR
jgi:hypothetical protein